MESHRRCSVLLSCFFINMLELAAKTSGVFLLPVQDSLQTDTLTLGVLMSTSQSLSYMFAPLITHVILITGERPVMICGSVMSSAALVMASFAQTVAAFGICLALTGIGYGMIYIPTISAISSNFKEKHVTTAMGFMSTGGAFGTMIFPPIAHILIQIYGWQGVMLLLGGLSMNLIVFSAIIHPHNQLCDNHIPSCPEEPECTLQGTIKRWYSNNAKLAYNSLCIRLQLFCKTPTFVPIPVYVIFSGACITGWVIFLVPNAIIKGLPSQQAAFLPTTGGIGFILGRLFPGPIIDGKFLTATSFGMLVFLTSATAFFLDSIFTVFWTLATLALLNGFCCGTQTVVFFAICKELLPKDDVLHGFSIGAVFFAIGSLIIGIIMGYVLNIHSSSFAILGGLALCAAFMLLASKAISKMSMDKYTNVII